MNCLLNLKEPLYISRIVSLIEIEICLGGQFKSAVEIQSYLDGLFLQARDVRSCLFSVRGVYVTQEAVNLLAVEI